MLKSIKSLFNSKSPLREALDNNNMDLFLYLLETKNGNPNEKDEVTLEPILITAIKQKNLKAVELLITYGAAVNQCDKERNPPLYHAINIDSLSIFKTLLKHGADIKELPTFSGYPGHHQAILRSSDIFKELIKGIQDINKSNETGIKPFDLAENIYNKNIYKNTSSLTSLEKHTVLECFNELFKRGACLKDPINRLLFHDKAAKIGDISLLYIALAFLPREVLEESFLRLNKYISSYQSQEIKDFLSAKEPSFAFLALFATFGHLGFNVQESITLAKQGQQVGATVQDITDTISSMFPTITCIEHFDRTFTKAYHNILKLSQVDHYAKQNGYLNLQTLPEEMSSSLIKELGISLPAEISESITSYTLSLPLNTTRLLSSVIKERLNTPSQERATLPSPQRMFCRKLIESGHLFTQKFEEKHQEATARAKEQRLARSFQQDLLQAKSTGKSSFSLRSSQEEGPSR